MFNFKKFTVLFVFLVVAIFLSSSMTYARSTYLSTFDSKYGTSGTKLDSCDTCHVVGGKTRNPYGLDVESGILAGKTVVQALTDVEPKDSDLDTYSNITEINARTFPGDPNDHPMPSSAVINLNPASLDFGTVTTGNSATKTTLVQNTGTANLNVSSIALCFGTSSEYTSSPAAPFTVAPGGSTTLSVAYSPVDATTDSGCLTIASNDPVNPTVSLSVTGTGVTPQPNVVDIDITGLTVLGRDSLSRPKAITPGLTVTNPGTVSSGLGLVTGALVGVENGVQVYSQNIALDNIAAGASATVSFPSYTPTVIGTIYWTVTVNDQDPDIDQATVATKVVK